jgi:hypothetical protein
MGHPKRVLKNRIIIFSVRYKIRKKSVTKSGKGMTDGVAGNADCLLFPNIESGNVFYKCCTKFNKAEVAPF